MLKTKTLQKILVILGMILIILVVTLFFAPSETDITGQAIQEHNYTYTKAICDENNLCEDYEISCEGEKVLDIKPTGFIVQNSKNWKDPRDKESLERICG